MSCYLVSTWRVQLKVSVTAGCCGLFFFFNFHGARIKILCTLLFFSSSLATVTKPRHHQPAVRPGPQRQRCHRVLLQLRGVRSVDGRVAVLHQDGRLPRGAGHRVERRQRRAGEGGWVGGWVGMEFKRVLVAGLFLFLFLFLFHLLVR